MNKLKWSLRAITICCAILPLLSTVLAYQNNPLGLVVPPQIIAAVSGNNQGSGGGQAIQEIFPDFSEIRNVEPTFNDDFHFNAEDGTFGFSVNLTSPLDTAITCNSLSLTVTEGNGTSLGTIYLDHSVTLVPGEDSTIPIEGALSQELVTLLQDSGIDLSDLKLNPEDMGNIDLGGLEGLDISNIHLTNVNLDIGGVQLHIDELNPTELFGSHESVESG